MFILAIVFIDGFTDMTLNYIFNNLGHITITHPEYAEKSVLVSMDYVIEDYTEVMKKINLPGITEINGEFQFGSILSSEKRTIEMIGKGIEYKKQNTCKNFRDAVEKGTFITDTGQICISRTIAEILEVDAGDSLLVLSTNAFGSFNVIELLITGLFNTQFEDENENFFILTIEDANRLMQRENTASFIELKIRDYNQSRELAEKLNNTIFADTQIKAYPWEVIHEDVQSHLSLFFTFMVMVFIIIIIVVGSGIVNSILMSVYERFRDFGTMRAIGLKKRLLFSQILIEFIFIGIFASLLGILLGGLITKLFLEQGIALGEAANKMEGIAKIMHPRFTMRSAVISLILGVGISIFGSFLPAVSAMRKKIIDALNYK
jgi:putative ABC transport system permease protein